MLILSRRPNEKILFPTLGVSLQIIRVSGKIVRIGIDAPPHVRVLREEVAEISGDVIPHASRQAEHEMRNRLNAACLGLQVAQRQLQLQESEHGQLENELETVVRELRQLDEDMRLQSPGGRPQTSKPRRRALIVEDNANESELLATCLKMSGYEVDIVNDGLAALMFLKNNPHPDAVLLDMCMPRLSGPKTVSSIRCAPELQDLKVFAISGASRKELGVNLGAEGVDRWFSKPVDVEHLVTEMNHAIDSGSLSA